MNVDARKALETELRHEADRLVLENFGPPGVIVAHDLSIVQFRGKTGSYLELPPGVPRLDLLQMARDELRIPLRRVLDDARAKKTRARSTPIELGGSPPRAVVIEIIPFHVPSRKQDFFVVLFDEGTVAVASETPSDRPHPSVAEPLAQARLRQELTDTKRYLESLVEQLETANEALRAANDEIVATNERLQKQAEELKTGNEELQTTNEELQTANEELQTANDEVSRRNAAIAELNDDLTNVLASVDIPIVLLDPDLRIRRFTPAAARTLRLVDGDVGGPFATKGARVAKVLGGMASQAFGRALAVESTAQDEEGRWYLLSARPYLTADRHVVGTVLSILDVDETKKGAAREAREYAERVFDTARECLVVLDQDLRIRSANRAFYRAFGLPRADVEGRRFPELGRGEWNLPVLTARLTALVEGDSFEDFRVEQHLPKAGTRAFVLNARRVEQTTLTLLAMEDSDGEGAGATGPPAK
jgi:two-component system CheB/CheR fusion protein